jgi:hypothetical protein
MYAAQSVQCLTTNWTIEVRSSAEAKDFSSGLCAQSSSEAHPGSYPIVTGGPFPEVKSGQGVTLITHPHLMCRSYIPLPFSAFIASSGTVFYFTLQYRNDTFYVNSEKVDMLCI